MHILFLSHYFPPEFNAPANRTQEHTTAWARKPGVEVTVVTNNPNHPAGVLFPGHENRWLKRETHDGVQVRRVKTYLAPNAGFLRRTLNYLFFVPMGIMGALGAKKPDVVIATSPQFFCAVSGFLFSRLRGRRFIFELRDIWPESIITVGAMTPGLVVRLLEKIELYMYRHSVKVVALTGAFKENLVARGIDPDKIAVIPNGVNAAQFSPRPRPRELAEKLGLGDRKVVSYIGTLGMAHALDKVVEVAQRLREREDIHFLLVGDGAQREPIKKMIAELKLTNIQVLPPVAREEVVGYYALSDIALVTLRDMPLFDTVLPSKMLEMLAMGRPVLASVGRYSGEILAESGGGVWVAPEDVEAMAEAITQMMDDPAALVEMGAKGREFIKENYNRENLAEEFLAAIGEVAKS